MESFDMFLVGNFVALPAFRQAYGIQLSDTEYVIPTRWQTALTQAGQIGALLGIFIAGPITNRVGYRGATMIGLMIMNGTIFISFFANSLPVFLVGQLLEGIPWGFFIANAPAYASEIAPLPLRGACTAFLQMCWAIGSIIVGATTYVLNQRPDQWAYRIPFAVQWIFPTPLLILVFFAPESPWWLVRRGRHEQALKSIERLGRRSAGTAHDTLAMMVRTVEIESKTMASPTYLDLFKGTDLRRTLIICFVYAGQNFAGNLIANQAVFFFEREHSRPSARARPTDARTQRPA
jgi:SP family general alpha glucoside:H+ symporter-like MFS transporter